MILWTIQDSAVWESLAATGEYAVPDDRLGFPPEEDTAYHHAHYAYRWLAQQMAKRIGPPPEGVHFPIWAWYKQQGQADGKPDMRSSHYCTGRPVVRMKLDVPDYEALITDFDGWNHALNYWHLSVSEDESNEFDSWIESLGVGWHDIGNWDLETPELRLVRSRVEDSWERMIGVNCSKDEWWSFPWKLRSFQATFWTLKRDHILSVERFAPR